MLEDGGEGRDADAGADEDRDLVVEGILSCAAEGAVDLGAREKSARAPSRRASMISSLTMMRGRTRPSDSFGYPPPRSLEQGSFEPGSQPSALANSRVQSPMIPGQEE